MVSCFLSSLKIVVLQNAFMSEIPWVRVEDQNDVCRKGNLRFPGTFCCWRLGSWRFWWHRSVCSDGRESAITITMGWRCGSSSGCYSASCSRPASSNWRADARRGGASQVRNSALCLLKAELFLLLLLQKKKKKRKEEKYKQINKYNKIKRNAYRRNDNKFASVYPRAAQESTTNLSCHKCQVIGCLLFWDKIVERHRRSRWAANPCFQIHFPFHKGSKQSFSETLTNAPLRETTDSVNDKTTVTFSAELPLRVAVYSDARRLVPAPAAGLVPTPQCRRDIRDRDTHSLPLLLAGSISAPLRILLPGKWIQSHPNEQGKLDSTDRHLETHRRVTQAV